MKSSFLLLSLISVTALGAVNAQVAHAEPKEGGARWTFAPNIYRTEQARVPKEMDGPRAVRAGSVPQGSNFLGLDPAMLSKPTPQVAAKPITVPIAQVSNKLFIPGTSYKPSFGSPVQPAKAEPMKMAVLPPGAGSPIPMTAPPVAKPVAVPVHASAPRHIHTAVSGSIRKPHKSHGESAPPAVAASYSSGYMPGGSLPAQSGAGSIADSKVSGRVLRYPNR